MSLFVTAFFIQWWSVVLVGIWNLVSSTEEPFFLTVLWTTFPNIGGILNGILFIVIRKRLFKEEQRSKKQNDIQRKSETDGQEKIEDASLKNHTEEMYDTHL